MSKSKDDWRAKAPREHLQQRADLLERLRHFFKERNVLEVDTPLMSTSSVTQPHLASIMTHHGYYLQTSPEYAMKRLLCSGSGDIYQLCKAFRHEEQGTKHREEFTMLEWYRVGFTHHDLMQEVDAFLHDMLGCAAATKQSYHQLFESFFSINPHDVSIDQLNLLLKRNKITLNAPITTTDEGLDLLLSHVIEPSLGIDAPCFIYDYPATQAALARIKPGSPPVAERFEVYIQGIEVGNGFHELNDAEEQRARFQQDNLQRAALNFPQIPLDEHLLSALAHGLPPCAGIAMGFDRLVMLACQTQDIQSVLCF